jgi:hypothetical protein
VTMVHPHQGRPNLGQPEAPLTAVCSATLSPSRLSSVRYSPCTCSPMEAACDQTCEQAPTVQSRRGSIDNLLPLLGMTDETFAKLPRLLYTYPCSTVKRRDSERSSSQPCPDKSRWWFCCKTPSLKPHDARLPMATVKAGMTGTEVETTSGLRFSPGVYRLE